MSAPAFAAGHFPGYAAGWGMSPYGAATAAASAWPPPLATSAPKLETVALPTTSTATNATVPKLENTRAALAGAPDNGDYQPNCFLYPPSGLAKTEPSVNSYALAANSAAAMAQLQDPRMYAMAGTMPTHFAMPGANYQDFYRQAMPPPHLMHGIYSMGRVEPHICRWVHMAPGLPDRPCHAAFYSLKDIVEHLNNDHVSNDALGRHVCCWEGCPRNGREFKAKYKLVNHLRVHTQEKPFVCSGCSRTFARSENLKIHERLHT
ncbi:pair-rule protein odd-paired-like protein, partial [Aphelenchoides avenae]